MDPPSFGAHRTLLTTYPAHMDTHERISRWFAQNQSDTWMTMRYSHHPEDRDLAIRAREDINNDLIMRSTTAYMRPPLPNSHGTQRWP